MVRTVSRQATALTNARERRRALDAARDEQDRRVEEATAEALVALEARREAEQGLQAATATLAETLRALLVEDVLAERAAALLEMDTAEVRAADEDDRTASGHSGETGGDREFLIGAAEPAPRPKGSRGDSSGPAGGGRGLASRHRTPDQSGAASARSRTATNRW